MTVRHKALLALLLISILWGTAGVVAKILLKVADPFVITFYRFGIASLIILPFFLRENKPRHYWKILIPLSLLNSINVLFFYIGLTSTTANAAYVIGVSAPLATALLSRQLIREEVSASKFLGVLLGLIGTLLVILLPSLEEGRAFVGDIRGNIIVACGTLSWVLYAIGTRYVVSNGKFSPLTTAAMNIFVTTFVSLIFALATNKHLIVPEFLSTRYLPILLYASVMITVVTFFLFQWAIKHVAATTASLKEYMQLIIGVGFNTFILGESLTVGFLMGASLVIAGVFIATGQKISRKFMSIVFPIRE